MNMHSVRNVLIGLSNRPRDLTVNESTIIWQLSHVWFAVSEKSEFSCIEEFYLYLVFNVSPFESRYENQLPWPERVNKNEWCNGLQISSINTNDFLDNWETSLREASETDEEDSEFTLQNVVYNGSVKRAWELEENVDPQFPFGCHNIFVAETDSQYLMLERNLES